jgi:type I restriction enzyme S subunit
MQSEFTAVHLGKLAIFEMGQSPSSAYVSEEEIGLPFLQGNAEFGAIYPTPGHYCSQPHKLCQPGDVLISVRAPVGELNKADQTYVIGRGLAAVRFTEIPPEFGWHLLNYWVRDLHQLAQGSTFKAINKGTLESLSVLLPPLREQRRIAEILDAADEAIRQMERVIAKLKAVKAGLLHDLLTRGLDEHGHLRDPGAHPEQFKDSPLGRIPRKWEISSVEFEFELATGFTLGPHRQPRKNKRPYLRVANVLRGKVLLGDIAELEASDSEMIGRVLQEGDLLVVEGHANPDEIGRCARVPAEAEGLTFQNHLFRLRSKRLNTRFALAWLNGHWIRDHWRRMCRTSSGLNTINGTMLKNLPVPVPGGQEQGRVAAILDAHDVRIRTEETELAKLRQVKRGLMDDLLTGRVRVV